MHARMIFRRIIVELVGMAVLAGGLTVLAAVPAAAGFAEITRSSWAYIDVQDPQATFTEGDAPEGAWRDGKGRIHSSKSYFTFDLAPLRGTRVLAVEAFVTETAANDCDKPRSTEMWVTDPIDRPTWTD